MLFDYYLSQIIRICLVSPPKCFLSIIFCLNLYLKYYYTNIKRQSKETYREKSLQTSLKMATKLTISIYRENFIYIIFFFFFGLCFSFIYRKECYSSNVSNKWCLIKFILNNDNLYYYIDFFFCLLFFFVFKKCYSLINRQIKRQTYKSRQLDK